MITTHLTPLALVAGLACTMAAAKDNPVASLMDGRGAYEINGDWARTPEAAVCGELRVLVQTPGVNGSANAVFWSEYRDQTMTDHGQMEVGLRDGGLLKYVWTPKDGTETVAMIIFDNTAMKQVYKTDVQRYWKKEC